MQQVAEGLVTQDPSGMVPLKKLLLHRAFYVSSASSLTIQMSRKEASVP